ncbi:MAG: hypothetical protein A3J46_01005 [Candidatus Yanofskybacteria bacterium RIFCSPHIGHO2_02_FULL_41_11]|uniref:PEGA domain-containing protein n=1 Tax=Candidatus Yanofskybacteria bacterium RIFCSPHIGHO2_02_FULL_41_11 TaxID=1802675 RepID=A0A1F8F4Z6_9BACT|nr:MAG: hypothetical protein A3J46_01005 [Candidatus Yanofskybacteria bacterium RIFCSPHIGHO2_02_FULL_41_11]
MTKRFKRWLFCSAVVIFLILSYVIILYAQGYKYSFFENKFFKTGAIYLKVNTDADVYLNDKLLGDTSFFNNSYRIEGLLPGKYAIKIRKNYYSTWQKQVTVDEGFVSEFSKIFLMPKDGDNVEKLEDEVKLIFVSPSPIPTSSSTVQPVEPFIIKKGVLSAIGEDSSEEDRNKPEIIAENVKGYVLSKNKNKLAWWTANELWVIWLNDASYQPYHKKGDKELITRFSTSIKKVVWFRDEDHLIIDSGLSTHSTSTQGGEQGRTTSPGQAGYKILEIDTRGGINIVEV